MRVRPLLLAAALLAAPAGARADSFWGDDVELMADEELGAYRGGIAIAPGLDVNFGVEVTTYVNGAPALTTTLTWNESGQFVAQTMGDIGQQIDELTPEQRAALGLEGLAGAGGVVISDADGVTALAHNVTDGALQNIIVNTATGRDLRQEVDVTLELPGFEAVQDSFNLERFGFRLSDDMSGIHIGN